MHWTPEVSWVGLQAKWWNLSPSLTQQIIRWMCFPGLGVQFSVKQQRVSLFGIIPLTSEPVPMFWNWHQALGWFVNTFLWDPVTEALREVCSCSQNPSPLTDCVSNRNHRLPLKCRSSVNFHFERGLWIFSDWNDQEKNHFRWDSVSQVFGAESARLWATTTVCSHPVLWRFSSFDSFWLDFDHGSQHSNWAVISLTGVRPESVLAFQKTVTCQVSDLKSTWQRSAGIQSCWTRQGFPDTHWSHEWRVLLRPVWQTRKWMRETLELISHADSCQIMKKTKRIKQSCCNCAQAQQGAMAAFWTPVTQLVSCFTTLSQSFVFNP